MRKNKSNQKITTKDLLTNKVVVHFDMLGPGMKHRLVAMARADALSH